MKFLFLTTFSNETLVEKTQLHCLSQSIEVIRINIEDLAPNNDSRVQVTISDDDVMLTIDNQIHALSEFSLIWKRRISNNFLSGERIFAPYGNLIPKALGRMLISEIYEVRDLILHFARKFQIKIVNDYDPVCLSKPFQSIKAAELGLKSPSIVVSNTLSHINSFVSSTDSITKPIGGLGYMLDEEHVMSIKTTSIDLNYTDDIAKEVIFPSFVQERIKSKYELKCILVGKKLYCIKQYSTTGDIPTTDIKEAIATNQIKKEQYTLNAAVENKVVKLCKFFKLDVCTLDIIYSDQEEYAFIEINPDGIVEYYGGYLDKPIHESIFQLLLQSASSEDEHN